MKVTFVKSEKETLVYPSDDEYRRKYGEKRINDEKFSEIENDIENVMGDEYIPIFQTNYLFEIREIDIPSYIVWPVYIP